MKKKDARALLRLAFHHWDEQLKAAHIKRLQKKVGRYAIIAPFKNYYRSLKQTFKELRRNGKKNII